MNVHLLAFLLSSIRCRQKLRHQQRELPRAVGAYQLVTQMSEVRLRRGLLLPNQDALATNFVSPAVHAGPCTALLRASLETHRH